MKPYKKPAVVLRFPMPAGRGLDWLASMYAVWQAHCRAGYTLVYDMRTGKTEKVLAQP